MSVGRCVFIEYLFIVYLLMYFICFFFFVDTRKCTYLFALNVFPAFPLGETGSPVLDHVCFAIFPALALAKSALSFDSGHSVHL